MKRELFLKDVMHEIEQLKLLGTEEEKSRLNFDILIVTYVESCIYGQMTGSCLSPRAKELMDAACIRVMDLEDGIGQIYNREIEHERFNINGKNEGQSWLAKLDGTDRWDRKWEHISALEAYICTKNAKNEDIIKYIKGEIPSLNL